MAAPKLSTRAAGILLHPTSLPGPYTAGDLGPEAYRFAEAIFKAGLRWWQMLPITPPGPPPGYSPYSSTSAFSGSPFLISPRLLLEQGLLAKRDLADAPKWRGGKIDFTRDRAFRTGVLRKAFARAGQLSKNEVSQREQFAHENAYWLNDWCLYAALKDTYHDAPLLKWPTSLRLRKPDALAAAKKNLTDAIDYQLFVQWIFDRQWMSLKQHCNNLGIGLIGDIPIFVSHDSAAVWANPDLFLLDRNRKPTLVSGYPPDAFSKLGQLWGHPQYNWPKHAASGFAWWISRFERTLQCFDAARIDHFLGFHRVWAVPAHHKNAIRGSWKRVPGDALFAALRKHHGSAPIIAEDLGAATPQALALRDKYHFPGMRILQFAFGDGDYHRPYVYPRRCVAYTGTHDNETIVGWYENLKASSNGQWTRARAFVGDFGKEPHWAFIRAIFTSVAATVIIPMQDALGLGAEHRMNVPGVAGGNWNWRMDGLMPQAVIKRLHQLCDATGRLGPGVKSGKTKKT